MRKPIIIFFSTFFFFLSITAQEKYRAVQWGLKEGLSQGCAYHMLKDANGFLWIGTQGGLSRFDGSIFKNYYHDPHKSGTINAGDTGGGIVEDSLHNIWIGTDKGLYRYDIKADTFTHFLPAAGPASPNTYMSPIWATRDELFCAESDSVISSYNIHSLVKKRLITLASVDSVGNGTQFSYSFFDERSNSLWMLRGYWGSGGGPPGGGLLQVFLSTGKKQYYSWNCYKHIPGHNHAAEAMCYDRNRNCLWINSWEGLMQFTLDNKQFHYISALNNLLNTKDYGRWVGISMDLQGRVWLATQPKGIVVYDPSNRSVEFPFPEGSELQKGISEFNACIYCDRDGIVWSGFWFRKGIYQVIPFSPCVKHYVRDTSKPFSFNAGNAINLTNAGQDKMWIGSDDGLIIFDTRTDNFQTLKEKDLPGLKGTRIFPLFIDTIVKKGILVGEGYFIVDLDTKKCQPLIFKDSANHEVRISGRGECRFRGLIINGTYNNRQSNFMVNMDSGVAREVLSFPVNTIIPFGSFGIYASDDGFMFLRRPDIFSNLTYAYHNNKWILSHSPLDSIPWSHIIYNKKDQGYWAVAEKQLIHYSKNLKLIHTYTPAEGLPDIDIYSLLADAKGNIWFNTDRSIHQLNIETGVFSTLSEKDGFEPQNFSNYPPISMGTDGDLYLGEGLFGDGFVRISPNKYSNTSSSVYLQSLKVNQKPFALSTGVNDLQKLSLRYFQNKISIETGIIDYYSKGSSHIQYKLEGLNDNWQYGPANYTIRYDGLAPRKYTLLMQSSNAANEFNGPVKTLLIYISPPWWQTWWAYTSYALLLIFALWAFIRRRTRALKKEKIILEEKVAERTKELKEEKEIVESTLSELKSTQAQLIQSEKMASLGELTAGIAHEIQNPLNFVNNFSEVNTELIDELEGEAGKGNIAEIRAIAKDIKENEKKINYHGKRADAIVKGMLLHSRAGTGNKEPTDINALADEYLRLCYHGLRAKDKSFNATLETDFDKNIGSINIIPQDIGRVLLNLFNNAFYAVSAKKKQVNDEYQPTVAVRTKKIGGKVEINVKDNGTGIPLKVIDKIFQPFFTTKPTGQGTGLGLSLSYDIIKAHGGQIRVESKEEEGTVFCIDLPVSAPAVL